MNNCKSFAHPEITNRSDLWWLSSTLALLGLILGFGYLGWAALQGANYEFAPYTSPVYSAPFVPSWWPFSPAFLLIWIPAGFRLTCYYGRKVYYRSVFADPVNVAVDEPYRHDYKGESSFPFILANLHRYFLYFALLLVLIHWTEFFMSLFLDGSFYLGLGTLILLLDTLALTFYVFGCHSLRHIFSAKSGKFSGCDGCPKKQYHAWKKISALNQFHNLWFWVSLFSICVADLYIRLLASGAISADPHLIF